VATVVTAGLLLAPSLATSAGAATTPSLTTSAKAVAPSIVKPHTTANPVCLTGEANSYEFYTWCQGASPGGYRTIAYCGDGQTAVIGIEYADGSGSLSYADCSATGGQDSTLDPLGWGVVECSNYNGSGTFQGYVDTKGDISQILANWGGTGGITAGGSLLCQYSIGEAQEISPTTPIG
jgi:hypothetical protein